MPELPYPNMLGPEPTLLPDSHPDVAVAHALEEGSNPTDQAAAHPASSLAWALLAEAALNEGQVIAAYAYARTGYHRGLDALRKAGWRGAGPVPFDHVANQGFLRALSALGKAATHIGEAEESERIAAFIKECDPKAATAIDKMLASA